MILKKVNKIWKKYAQNCYHSENGKTKAKNYMKQKQQ